MCEAGLASTTMIQRSKTYVFPVEYMSALYSHSYNEHLPTDLADKINMAGPLTVGRLIVTTSLHAMAEGDIERYETLSRAGFLTEARGDVFWNLYEGGGGHYVDIGASKKIADGKVCIVGKTLSIDN
jgi:hypothetical protein